MGSAIEWTNETWNPVVGCSKVSRGCDNCYAEKVHEMRMNGRHGYPVYKPWTPENAKHNVTMRPEKLEVPLRWRKPRMVFVNSMSDLFHPRVTGEFIARVFAVMAEAERHTFQILTKRPKRMARLLADEAFLREVIGLVGGQTLVPIDWPLPNVWVGTSIEDREQVERADRLREAPAAVRFISAEPLLGPLVERGEPYLCDCGQGDPPEHECCSACGDDWSSGHTCPLDLTDIDWLIVGGESGPKARPMDARWVRELRDVALSNELDGCRGRTKFFFKQWGGRTPKAGGRELDGRTWDEFPASAARLEVGA